MSNSELLRVEVLGLRRSGSITQSDAARRLEVSVRQVRRLEAQIALHGPEGLRSLKRDLPSNNKTPDATIALAVQIIRDCYRDFGPTLAAQYLAERHGLLLSKETVRKAMTAAKLWRPKRGPKARIYALRERRLRFGELIQVDGSSHDWFEGRADRCCLIVFIDDATSRLTQLRFVDAECTFGYMHALYDHILEYGLPMTLYSDRHGIFRVNAYASKDEHQSQLGRALETLGIEAICANSPQAKGRVERANSTLQDRLIKAMRVDGITGIEAGNAWLPSFILDHNRRFAVTPGDPADAHVALQSSIPQLRHVLSKHSQRKLSKNLSCQFKKDILQVSFETGDLGMRGASITISECFDGVMEVLWRQHPLSFTLSPRALKAPATADRKDILKPSKPAYKHPPKPDRHPWKLLHLGKISPEFVRR